MRYKEALKTMITGETEASHTYGAFSQKAQSEGFHGVALLFKALAAAELIHIKNHRNALKEEFHPSQQDDVTPLSTIENVKNAILGEHEEARTLYPKLMKGIKKELDTLEGKVANLSLQWAMDAEKKHLKLLQAALKALQSGADSPLEELYICKVCGNILLPSEKDKECALCGHDSLFFARIEK